VGGTPEIPAAGGLRSSAVTILGTALFGAAVGAVIGALTLVRRGLVAQLWRQGSFTDLLWIAGGAAVGAGLILLWTKLFKKRAKAKVGVWLGGIVGATVVAPGSVAAGLVPAAAAWGGLFAIGAALALVLNVRAAGRASLPSSLLAGGAFGLFVGVALRLVLSVLEAAKQAVHGDLGRAFREMLTQVAADAVGIAALACAAVGCAAGLLLFWRLHIERRKEPVRRKA
jgi:hypothetical protein